MKNCAKINLCIVGSTRFGKSSIAASLPYVAATTDGALHLLGSPAKIMQMADHLKEKREHEGTDWDDIIKFQFRLDSDGKSWQITLRDYPGGLFSNYLEQRPLMERIKQILPFGQQAQREQQAQSGGKHVFDRKTEQIAKKTIRQLEQADALLVLVPADINDDIYDSIDRAIYKQKLPEFIERVMAHKPNIPVCLCINKWDMFDCEPDKLEDKLKEPPFCDFYQSLQFVCKENLSTAAISAFGGHDPEDKSKIAPGQEQKPRNILRTLIKLAKQAEEKRIERERAEWEKSNWLAKTLFFPCKTLLWLSDGYTSSDIRSSLVKMAAKAWGYLFASFAAIAFLIAAITTAGISVKESLRFQEMDARFGTFCEVPQSVTKQKLQEQRSILEKPDKYAAIVRRVFFSSRLSDLTGRLDEIEKKYNDRVKNEAMEYCAKLEHKDLDPWANPEERKTRATCRKNKLDNAKEKLANVVNYQKHKAELSQKISEEKTLLEDLKRNWKFYTHVYNSLHDRDRKTICQRISDFISKERETHPEQKTVFVKLEEYLVSTENDFSKELKGKIEKEQAKPVTSYKQRAERFELLSKTITAYESYFAKGSPRFKQFAAQRTEFEKRRTNELHYGPFDEEFSVLNRDSLQEMDHFLKKYQTDYPERGAQIQNIRDRLEELTGQKKASLEKCLKENKDVREARANKRIESCEKCAQACLAMLNEAIPGTELRHFAEDKLREYRALKEKLVRYASLEEEFAELEEKESAGKLRQVDAFEKKYSRNDYPDHNWLFDKLAQLKQQLTVGIDAEVKTLVESDDLKDRDTLDAKRRIKCAKTRKEKYDWAVGEYIQDSPEQKYVLSKCSDEDLLIRDLEKYVQFDDDYKNLNQNDLRALDEFCKKYSQEQYPRYVKKITALMSKINELSTRVCSNLSTDLEKMKDDPRQPAEKRITDCNRRISKIKTARAKLGLGSKEMAQIQQLLENEESFLQKLADYKAFEGNASQLLMRGGKPQGKIRRIDAFLKNNPESRYTGAYHKTLFRDIKTTYAGLLKDNRDKLNASLGENKEDHKLSAKINVQRAEARKKAYELARDEYVEGSDDWAKCNEGVSQSELSVGRWTPYIEFEKEYKSVQEQPTRLRLTKINELIAKYDRNAFSYRDDYFIKLNDWKVKWEKELQETLAKELNNVLAPKAQGAFSEWIKFHTDRRNIFSKYKPYYPESSEQAQNILNQIRESEEAIGKYRDLSEFRQTIENICHAAEKQKAKIIIPMIQDFYSKFPKGKYPGLEADYQKITEIQTRAAVKIVEAIDKGLDQCKPEDAQNEREKQSSYDASIKIIDDKLPLLQGTPQYAFYKARRDIYWNNLNKSRRDEFFHNEQKKLQKFLDDSDLSPGEKIVKIDAFLAKFKNEYSGQCEEFGHRRSQLMEAEKWLRLKADIEKHLASMPDDSSSAQLRSYQEKCGEYKDALRSFPRRTDVEKAENDLDDMIKKINDMIGDGSFADVQQKKRDYEDAPNATTHRALETALKAFFEKNSVNHKHFNDAKAIKEQFEKDWTARNEVKNSWEKLCRIPNYYNYELFRDALGKAKGVFHPEELKKYEEYLIFLTSFTISETTGTKTKPIIVELVELSGFEKFGTVAGKLRVKLYAKNKKHGSERMLLDFKCSGYSWKNGQVVHWQHEDSKFTNEIYDFLDYEFIICSIGNWQGGKGDNDKIPVKPWEVLVRLACGENGVEMPYTCPKGVSVTLKFTKE